MEVPKSRSASAARHIFPRTLRPVLKGPDRRQRLCRMHFMSPGVPDAVLTRNFIFLVLLRDIYLCVSVAVPPVASVFRMPPLISAQEVVKHDNAKDLWLVVDRIVYDLTSFAPEHPGGTDILLQYAGRDATAAYNDVHAPSLIKNTLPSSKHVGPIDAATIPRSWTRDSKPAQQEQQPPSPAPPSQRKTKPPLTSLISSHDFAHAASLSFSPKTWAFVSSAATDLHTLRRNADSYAAIGLRPRALCDVSRVDTSTTVLGHAVPGPIFGAPTSLGRLVHPEGEKELARACRVLGIPLCVSTSASFPLAEIVAAVSDNPRTVQPGGKGEEGKSPPLFFQLYVDRDRRKSERLLREATALGIKALFVTVDAPVPGKREADERVAADKTVATPMTGARAVNDAKGGALGRVMGKYIDSSLSWADVPWLRSCVPGVPLVLKGVQTAADAVRAMRAGADAIVVSNHGGRSLDTAPATVLVLLELQRCCPEVFDAMEVYVDGGISRGTDIFKALCLGAKAVGIGRGLLYGLNYGAEGVRRYVESECFLLPHHPSFAISCVYVLFGC